ncbi:YoaK family protein [Hansschlegelia quercus]|uniref:DUF1275 domain-containing protein n=1 Tax=Hansschlegelia quercus TaxID=2528245 RepID=A0A4Q9GNE8_9HYPH|nr:DUF1275 family protein [Hansschlegelia quercus]TBN55021.1 DUF1275 domain-containing protein [Hansschlegelia quercus]
MRDALPAALSLNAGFVDTAGFLALHGLFTTHVTGNFVTLGAALVTGASGTLAKLLALPLFCVVVALATLLGHLLARAKMSPLRSLLFLQFLLLVAASVLAVQFGPFPNGDAPTALAIGGALVAAMAIQNAAQRLHLSAFPPTTIMTGTTTQIMIDVAELMRRDMRDDVRAAAKARLKRMSLAVAVFALGCAAAAIFFAYAPGWCFAAPPVLAAVAMVLPDPADASAKA